MLSPTEWLARVGFSGGNPFALKWAEEEREHLHEYFVEHQAYHAVIDSGAARSCVLHAPRGAGKSSTRRMFEDYCRAHDTRLRAVLVRLTDWMPIVERAGSTRVGPRELLDEVLRLFVVALADLPAGPAAPLPPDEAGYLGWIGQARGDYLRPSQRAALVARGWIAPPEALAPGQDGYSLAGMPVLRCFEAVARIAAAAGRPTCFLVIDGVDELCETSADWSAGADLLAPLIGNVRLLEVPGLAVKCFVPTEIVAILRERGQLRDDRVATVELTWSRALLRELLRSRLAVFSDDAVRSLAMIAAPDLADIDDQLCQAAEGSPRRLLRLCDSLVQACARTAADADLLLRQAHVRAAVSGAAPEPLEPPAPTIVAGEPARPIPLLRLDPDGSVWRGAARLAEAHRLSYLQRRLLTYLYEHRGRLCSTDELISHVWAGRDEPSDKDSLRRLADRLVEQIEPDPRAPIYLERPYGGFFVLRHAAD